MIEDDPEDDLIVIGTGSGSGRRRGAPVNPIEEKRRFILMQVRGGEEMHFFNVSLSMFFPWLSFASVLHLSLTPPAPSLPNE